MKKLNSKTMAYIAKTYGKKYAEGDEVESSDDLLNQVADSGPNASMPADQSADSSVVSEPALSAGATGTWASPPPGYDGSPDANPNVPISANTLAQADLPPTSDTPSTQTPAAAEDPFQKAGVPNIEGAYQEEQKANTAGANAQADQGKAEVEALDAEGKALAALPSANSIAQDYKKKDEALAKAYMNAKVDPNHYFHSMSTGKHILAGIAILLGGGTGGPVTSMIDNSIKRDIDAQKNAQDQALNLWKMNREQYGNDQAANLATQNQLLVGTQVQLNRAASAAKAPTAMANAQSANALIDQKLAENRFKLSLMQPTSDSFGIDPAKKVSWLVPQSHQQKVFDEIDSAENTTRNAPAILKSFDDAAQNIHGVDFVPGIDNADQKALHALLGPTFKDVEGTVRQAAMDNMFKNTTPQFGDDKNTIARKRDALIGYMTSKSSAPTASGFGINLGQYPSTNVKGAIPVAPNSPEAKAQARAAAPIRYDAQGRAWMKNAEGQVVPAGTKAR